MNRIFVRVLGALAPVLASCSPSVRFQTSTTRPAATDTSARAPSYAMRETPDAPLRAHAPPVADAPPPSASPPIRSFRLANGIPVIFLEQHMPGLLRVVAMLHAQPAPFGANEMAARSLWLGTAAMNQSQLQAANDADGAVMTSEYDWGWFRVGITATPDRVASSVARLSSVILDASFPPGQYVPYALRAVSEIEPSDDAPDAIATRLIPLVLYASPPESHPEDDANDLRSPDVGGLRRDQVADAYDAALDPSSAALVVVGDSTEETLKPILEKAFGGWHAKKKRARSPWTKPVLATSSPRLVVVDQPGGEPHRVRGGRADVFHSGVGGAMDAAPHPRRWSEGRIAAAFRSANLDRTGRRARLPREPARAARHAPGQGSRGANSDRPRRARRAPPPDEERRDRHLDDLAYARRLQLVGLQRLTSPVAGAADEVEGLVVQSLPPDDVPQRAPRYVALTSGDLQRAAARYLDPDRMKVVVVGDWSKMRAQVEGLGWGPVELRSSAGAVLGVEGAQVPR